MRERKDSAKKGEDTMQLHEKLGEMRESKGTK